MESFINAVSTLHQSLWLDGTSQIWFELATSSLSEQGIDEEGFVIQIRVD